jgi:glycosyltransferase involved in cell wall biosynthesis
MKILFVADGRSPIALNWIKHWTARGDEVFLVSTYPADPKPPASRVDFVPVAFSQAKSAPKTNSRKKKSLLWGATTLKLRMGLRHWLGPLTLPKAARRLEQLVAAYQPDLVHALRVPYEGMLAAAAKQLAPKNFPPLLVSIWGNDFTLHATASPLMSQYTRQTLRAADALHADCRRDIRLAETWGFDIALPHIVLPGAGGIDGEVFYPPSSSPVSSLVINPRGIRSYVRNDTFFKAIPLVLKKRPEVQFICPNMAGESQAIAWVEAFGIQKSVTLTPPLERNQLADKFRSARILVSPSTHDGTPNSLLEGMACGCFPIAGDLESIREWITPEVNGLLINPADEQALADAILRALNDDDLREQAVRENQKIIAERAEYNQSMARAENFYRAIIARKAA